MLPLTVWGKNLSTAPEPSPPYFTIAAETCIVYLTDTCVWNAKL